MTVPRLTSRPRPPFVGIVGDEDTLTLSELGVTREQTVAFELAKNWLVPPRP